MATEIQPGTVIGGKYRVVRRIGEGGMGTVYEGENIRIERRVAIKVLHEHVASTPEFAQRFEREARASARIGSPHVCDVLDLGDFDSGERFIVMEFLEGESFEERLVKGRITAHELAPIAFEVLEGLGTMHQAGVIHRDLKPANVFLARRPGGRAETVKILDFGVAKLLPRGDEPNHMTSTGTMMGTPLYMSPEQARGARDVDGRTDLYAASVMFYRALTGEMPHSGDNLHELLFKIVLEDPRPIRELAPDVDDHFAAIVTRGLARDADQRFPSARAYQAEIAAWGRAQGRASLEFAVTLSSQPPARQRSISSGGFSMAAVKPQMAASGPNVVPLGGGTLVGPPTPPGPSAPATPGSRTPAGGDSRGTTPSARQSGGHASGTPIVWSEDAPSTAGPAAAGGGARAPSGGEVSRSPERLSGPPSPSREGASLVERSHASPSARRAGIHAAGRAAVGVGVLAVVAAAALVGARFATRSRSSPAATGSPSEEGPSASEPGSGASAPPPRTSSLSPAVTSAQEASASGAPSRPAGGTATTTVTSRLVGRAPSPVVAPTVGTLRAPPSATIARSAAPPGSSTPGPAPTTSHRKFRTNLE